MRINQYAFDYMYLAKTNASSQKLSCKCTSIKMREIERQMWACFRYVWWLTTISVSHLWCEKFVWVQFWNATQIYEVRSAKSFCAIQFVGVRTSIDVPFQSDYFRFSPPDISTNKKLFEGTWISIVTSVGLNHFQKFSNWNQCHLNLCHRKLIGTMHAKLNCKIGIHLLLHHKYNDYNNYCGPFN